MSKLTEADRIQMREMRRDGAKLKVIAAKFGCSVPNVCNVISGFVGKNDRYSLPPVPVRTVNAMPWCTPERLMAGKA